MKVEDKFLNVITIVFLIFFAAGAICALSAVVFSIGYLFPFIGIPLGFLKSVMIITGAIMLAIIPSSLILFTGLAFVSILDDANNNKTNQVNKE